MAHPGADVADVQAMPGKELGDVVAQVPLDNCRYFRAQDDLESLGIQVPPSS